MIALLKGILEYRDDPYIVVDVNGVGYKVLVSHGVLSKLAKIDEPIRLFTYTHVRQDLLELYGFSNQNDLKLFELLITVSGVGPKSAIGVFSLGTGAEITQAIVTGNVEFFTRVPRLGKKNAQKIIIELKNKVGSTGDLDLSDTGGQESNELISALRTFGFSRDEAYKAIRATYGEGKSIEEKVKLALKYLGK